MNAFTQTLELPLWVGLLVPAVIGLFAYLRGWVDGKGIGQ